MDWHSCIYLCIPAPCEQGDIRLVGGANALEGRIEVCYNNRWGTVCDDAWGAPDASVACRQLGYSDAGKCFPFHRITCVGQG